MEKERRLWAMDGLHGMAIYVDVPESSWNRILAAKVRGITDDIEFEIHGRIMTIAPQQIYFPQ